MDFSPLIAYIRQKFFTILLASLWLLPFISSIIGFQAIKWISGAQTVITPGVLGMPIGQAIKLLSDQSLNVRILKEKEDNTVPPGTILSQSPAAHEKIKKQQSVFLVITKYTPQPKAPNLLGMDISKAVALAQEKKFKVKNFLLQSHYPKNTVISQLPLPGETEEHNTLTVYISSGANQWRIMPPLKGLDIAQVEDFLKDYGIKPAVNFISYDREDQTQTVPSSAKVINQYPIAGTIIDSNALPAIELTVS